MIAKINKSRAVGAITVPPSKSIAHRMLIAAALSEKSVVNNVDFSADILATLDVLKAMGAYVEINSGSIMLGGINPKKIVSINAFCNESGSTIRFLLPLCLISGHNNILCGSDGLFKRPFTVYKKLCDEKKLFFKQNNNSLTVCGPLKSGIFDVDGGVSSQFISGLLFALPLLDGDSQLNITGNIESYSYIELTLDVLKTFGIKFNVINNKITVFGNQKYSSKDVTVEGDCSNAAFLDSLNLFGGNVLLEGLNEYTLQGDFIYKNYFEQLNETTPILSLKDCPDLGPILFAVAALKNGAIFTETDRLHIKESDRILCMKEELEKIGAEVTENANSVTIKPTAKKSFNGKFYGHNDHRIAMALSIVSSVLGGTVIGCECVNKSFPAFFKFLKALEIEVDIVEA